VGAAGAASRWWQVREAARRLRAGGVVAYPTEGVWGLGCDPGDAKAVDRVIALKGRPRNMGLIVLAADLDQVADWVELPGGAMGARLRASWPGFVTWVLPARPRVPARLTGGRGTLAVRVSAHPLAAALSREAGMPLVSTSANPHGRPPARSALDVRRYFGNALDAVVHGPLGGAAGPSPIYDARTGACLRP
jgi:L-threonylcarbamoyladenylate synthase